MLSTLTMKVRIILTLCNIENRPNLDPNTMQYREWQRGWNDAYVQKLKKVVNAEARARS